MVEDADGFVAEGAIFKDGDAAGGVRSLDLTAQLVAVDAVGYVDGKVRRFVVGEVLFGDGMIEDDVAVFARVIEEDTGNTEAGLLGAEGDGDAVADLDAVLFGEGFADDDGVA